MAQITKSSKALEHIDWGPVEAAVAAINGIQLSMIETIGVMVERAAGLWLDRDVERLDVGGIEHEFLYNVDEKGYIDLYGLDTEDDIPVVIDWKTRKGAMNDNWLWRTENSDEQRINYVRALISTQPELARYPKWRATLRMVFEDAPPRAHSILVDAAMLAETQASGWWGEWERGLERDLGYSTPWPNCKPSACRVFGPRYECEYLSACQRKTPMPVVDRGMSDLIVTGAHRSYSSGSEFKRCPERLRRLRIDRQLALNEDDTDLQRDVGSGFHVAIAEIYRQVFKVPDDGVENL